jgi:hypothetical protein
MRDFTIHTGIEGAKAFNSALKDAVRAPYLKEAMNLYVDCIIDFNQHETLTSMIMSEDWENVQLADMIMVNKRKQNGNKIQI